MLDPQQDRRQLFDALRPPAGYELDRAIGTTYSLDLLALLTVPLAYTFWSGEDEQGRLTTDPLVLLHGVRQVVDRLAIFCQAGQISVPRANQRLFTYLEDSIFEVVAPHRDGVFHPKIWLLRYTPVSEMEDTTPIRYRLLCLSRNLTFDQSWDTMLVLDGMYQAQRKVAYSRNHPLGDFIAALPGLAVRQLTPAAQSAVTLLSEEVRKVSFELPWWRGDIEFLPMGLNGRRSWPFPTWARRQLIVSPFISPGFLKKIGEQSQQNILISRLESAATLAPEVLELFKPVYVLDPTAEPEEAAEEENETVNQTLSPKSGLHAKLFVCEYGRSNVEFFTGSANATEAAFSRNVEFLVKITGKGAEIGIDKILPQDKGGSKEIQLLDLLQVYEAGETIEEPDNLQAKMEQLVTHWQRELARLPVQASVICKQPGAHTDEATFDIVLHLQDDNSTKWSSGTLPDHLHIACWPISLRAEDAVPIKHFQDPLAVMPGLSYAALTSFFAFSVTAEHEGESFSTRFVLNLPLADAPDDRREQALRALLDNRSKVLSYLMFLLAENDFVFTEVGHLLQMHETIGENDQALSLPVDLFESLVRALHKDPTKLDHIFSLVTDLQKSGQDDLLPEGFDEIWPPIWEARQVLRQRGNNRELS